jgi:hypothetical protein
MTGRQRTIRRPTGEALRDDHARDCEIMGRVWSGKGGPEPMPVSKFRDALTGLSLTGGG